MIENILLTDANYKNSLAILRSLKLDYEIDLLTQSSKLLTICWYSRYKNSIIQIEEYENLREYGNRILRILEMKKYDYFIPVGLLSYVAASMLKGLFLEKTNMLVPDWEMMEIAFNKSRTMEFGKELSIPIPWTIDIKNQESIRDIPNYPIVLKVQDHDGSFVRYINNPKELIQTVGNLKNSGRKNPIAQEYIKGTGYGFYAIYKNGKMFDFFMLKRIHELPITGGPSTLAVSVKNKELFEAGKKITDKLNWTGPIMVEFKYDIRDQRFKLIEINPKLWGSLDFTIAAGINVPKTIIGILNGEIDKPLSSHFEECRYDEATYRWTFPYDFEFLMSDFKTAKLKEFVATSPDYSNTDLHDPLPTLFNIGMGLYGGARTLVDFDRRFPNGVITRDAR